MANRKQSDAPEQHETIPGPGPNKLGDGGSGSGIHPVEQMVDAAIDRIALEQEASQGNHSRHALAIRRPGSSGRLRWKGLDVSDEFRQYAERVAQGEELPPFEGRILAEPNPTFPWEPSARKRATRRALGVQVGLWGSAAVVVGLICWSVAVRVRGPSAVAPTAPVAPIAKGEPSEAVLAIQGTGELPGQQDSMQLEAGEAVSAEGSVEADALASVPDPPVAAATPARPPAQPAAVSSRLPIRGSGPQQPGQSSSEASAEGELLYSHVPPPGALREALGALLAARAAPDEFPSESSSAAGGAAPGAGATSASGAPGSPIPGESSGAGQSPAAGSRPPPAGGASAPPVRKETGNEASGKDSLLVETPSF